ncbi:hypothetical protein Tco_0923615 [Tanacetum coccineum]|uniref:Uncharacterized protein n=1 Tax=Tanacetum coccineum TaxID=301880 RepID=A0ABQ5D4T2_9ASTR
MELRKISFPGGPTDSVVEHISNVLEIASIFNAHGSNLVQQEDGESLSDTWERYNDLLFKFPFHDLNDHQKVNTFYNGLNNQTRRTFDTNGLIPGLTASDALKSIQKLVKHSHKWHCEENHITTSDPLRIITKKLKLLNHEIEELTVDFRKLNTNDVRKSYYAEVKSIKSSKIDYDKTYTESSNLQTNLKDKFEQCLKESSERQAYSSNRQTQELVMNDEKVRDFENYLSPEYGRQDIILLSPSEFADNKKEFSMTLCNPDKRMSIGLEEFVDIDDMWDDLDPRILSNEKATTSTITINRGLIRAISTSLVTDIAQKEKNKAKWTKPSTGMERVEQEDDGNDRDTFDIWDITVEYVERIRQFFTPNVDVIENVIQPLIPKTLHTTPSNEDYVARATKSILDDLLEEFGDEILNVTMVDEGAKCNPAKDLEELERLLAKEPQSNFTEIQVHSVIINSEPFVHTQLMSPLYGVFKTSKPCKFVRIRRENKMDEEYDPYDDDLYESHDMFDNLQAICDELDITVRGQKKN